MSCGRGSHKKKENKRGCGCAGCPEMFNGLANLLLNERTWAKKYI
jgi:hypothetical protein